GSARHGAVTAGAPGGGRTIRSRTPTPPLPSTGWRGGATSSAPPPWPAGARGRRLCPPHQPSPPAPARPPRTAPALPRAELDATDAIRAVATMPGRADSHVVDAVPVEIAGVDDHAAIQLAWLAPRPVTKLLARLAGVDVNLSRKRPCLVLCRGRG